MHKPTGIHGWLDDRKKMHTHTQTVNRKILGHGYKNTYRCMYIEWSDDNKTQTVHIGKTSWSDPVNRKHKIDVTYS